MPISDPVSCIYVRIFAYSRTDKLFMHTNLSFCLSPFSLLLCNSSIGHLCMSVISAEIWPPLLHAHRSNISLPSCHSSSHVLYSSEWTVRSTCKFSGKVDEHIYVSQLLFSHSHYPRTRTKIHNVLSKCRSLQIPQL